MREGDWVQIWGQVKLTEGHPEDVGITLFSHNEEYLAIVRRDRVITVGQPPEFVDTCTALRSTKTGGFRRCTVHARHAGDHLDNKGRRWSDEFTVAHIEEE